MAEIDYNKVFGVEAAPESSGDNPAPTAPVAENNGTPDDTNMQPIEEGDNGGTDEVAAEKDKAPPEGKPESAAGDQSRHKESDDIDSKKEYQKQIEQAAQARAAKTIDDAIAALNLTNPYTKEPIKNKADYDAYREKVEADKRAKILKKTGMSEEEFSRFVADQPEVKRELEQARAAREEAARAAVNDQIRQIHEIDPTISSIEDLAKMPNYADFYKLVKVNRLNFIQAYKLVNMDKIQNLASAASRQAALNAAQSKSHLEPTKSRGKPADTVIVPPEVQQYYHMMNPKMSEADMRADYGRYISATKKGV